MKFWAKIENFTPSNRMKCQLPGYVLGITLTVLNTCISYRRERGISVGYQKYSSSLYLFIYYFHIVVWTVEWVAKEKDSHGFDKNQQPVTDSVPRSDVGRQATI